MNIILRLVLRSLRLVERHERSPPLIPSKSKHRPPAFTTSRSLPARLFFRNRHGPFRPPPSVTMVGGSLRKGRDPRRYVGRIRQNRRSQHVIKEKT